jgi:neopullulanase
MKNLSKAFCFAAIFTFAGNLTTLAQSNVKIYPTHWWTGMKNPKLQLLIYGANVAKGVTGVSVHYPGVEVVGNRLFENPNYLAVDLVINSRAVPGKLTLEFEGNASTKRLSYELKARSPENGRSRIRGVTSDDFIYLIMPDRFSNGDPSNDRVRGMKDQSLDRTHIGHRHGGDLKGIENKLDYLESLGVTALWLNPIIVNDMPERTEHGYAFTDHYTVDPRIGGDAAYKSLSNALHKRGMKLIQDAVYNHVGTEHFLFKDLPDSTWFHFWPQFTQTTYKDQVLMDPYASAIDKKRMSDGWFVRAMPDINQKNPFFANFLIQHAIWSTEEYGLDGWRIDTYAYNDLDFMNRCNRALLDQYPRLHLFGETWVHGIPNQSFFVSNIYNSTYKSNLTGVTDFQLNLYGIVPALTQNFGWTEGLNRLYLTATNDFVYKDPMQNVIFLDNHDMSRFLSVVGEDVQKLKMGIAWLLTFRGIPQFYYGTEVLMKNFSNPDGLVRMDFPGGWAGDSANKFTAAGRSAVENEVWNYTRALANYRKTSSAIKKGKMMQFVPEDGLFVYFRYDAKQTVMVIMNQNEKEMELNTARFSERINGFARTKNVVDGRIEAITEKIKVPAKTTLVLELVK